MKVYVLLLLFIFSILSISCRSDRKSSTDVNYKKWLSDTLSILKKENSFSYYRTYSVDKDSSSLMIETKIDTVIDKNIIIANSPELEYALSLLQRNKIMPEKKFRLISTTQCYYDVPYKNVGLTYDFQVDVVDFYVITDHSKKEYEFMKGNLTDSIIYNTDL